MISIQTNVAKLYLPLVPDVNHEKYGQLDTLNHPEKKKKENPTIALFSRFSGQKENS